MFIYFSTFHSPDDICHTFSFHEVFAERKGMKVECIYLMKLVACSTFWYSGWLVANRIQRREYILLLKHVKIYQKLTFNTLRVSCLLNDSHFNFKIGKLLKRYWQRRHKDYWDLRIATKYPSVINNSNNNSSSNYNNRLYQIEEFLTALGKTDKP